MANADDGTTGSVPGSTEFSFDGDGGTAKQDGNSAGKSSGPIDPATVAANSGNGSGTGKRGRPRLTDDEKERRKSERQSGAASGKKEKAVHTVDVKFVELLLSSINAGVVALTHAPEFEVTDEENKRLAAAIENLARYYPVYVDPKTQAWMALITVAGQVYGTRVVAYAMRPKQPKEPKQPQPHSIVQPMTNFGR